MGETFAERGRGEPGDFGRRRRTRPRAGLPVRAPLWVAYEPVWAIGTGVVATVDEVAEAHAWVLEVLGHMGRGSAAGHPPALYGGGAHPKRPPRPPVLPGGDRPLVRRPSPP